MLKHDLNWSYRVGVKMPDSYTEEDLIETMLSLSKFENSYIEDIHITNANNTLHGFRAFVYLKNKGTIKVNYHYPTKNKFWIIIDGKLIEGNAALHQCNSGRLTVDFFIYYKDKNSFQAEFSHIKKNIIVSYDNVIENDPDEQIIEHHHQTESIECEVSSNGELCALIEKRINLELDIYRYEIRLLNLNQNRLIWSGEFLEPHTLTFSPNNKYLLFCCISKEGYWDELVVLNLQTFKQSILRSGFHNISSLCWKEDSKFIYFVCDDDKEEEQIEQPFIHKKSLSDKLSISTSKVVGQVTFSELEQHDHEFIKRLSIRKQSITDLIYCSSTHSLFYVEGRYNKFLETTNYLIKLNLNTFKEEEFLLSKGIITDLTISPYNHNILAFFGSRENKKHPSSFYGYGVNIYDLRLHVIDLEMNKRYQVDNEIEGLAGVPFGTSTLNSQIHWLDDQTIKYVMTTRNKVSLAITNYKDRDKAKLLTIVEGHSKCHTFDNKGNCYMFLSEECSQYELASFTCDNKVLFLQNQKQHTKNFETFDVIKGYSWMLAPSKRISSKTPLIVNLYGGASPLTKGFDILHHLLLSKGFSILIMNPTGASGYGNACADSHLDDWGQKATEDVDYHVSEALKRFNFIDSERIGIYGGSFGGFLTSLLLSKTSIFKAGCSISGISSIPNYIGSSEVGFLYSYSSLKTLHPWSEKMIDQSPLNRCENITAPLLLIHGMEDNKVPVAESEQLFTFLTLQQKDVSLYTFKGEGHNLRKKPSTFVTVNNLIVNWFEEKLIPN
jgi:poly(3-hydroxybutyrate) depolymerase